MTAKKRWCMEYLKKAITICTVLAISIVPISSIAHASEMDELNRVTDEVIKYVTINEKGVPEYHRTEAIENGVSEEVLDIADQTFDFLMVKYYEENDIQTRATAFPIYGNWCGPNYGSGTPIDLLDKACKKHDNCYRDNYRHKCSCDQAMLTNINNNYSKMTGAKQKAMAKVMVAWLKIKTSNQNNEGGNFSCKI